MKFQLSVGLVAVSALALLSSVATADHEIGYTASFQPVDINYTAEWCLDASTIHFRVSAEAAGWLGLGFSDNQLMPDSDIIQMNGAGEIQDGWALFRAAPPSDSSQDVVLHSATEEGGMTVVEFSRALDTGDEDDMALNTPVFLLWAYHATLDSFNARHQRRGFSTTMLDFSAASPCSTGPSLDFNDDGELNTADIDDLAMEIIAATHGVEFDLTGDTLVNVDDLTQWRNAAALANGFSEPYLLGDANLDGSADVEDLNSLGISWQTSPNTWSGGDFTVDGFANVEDLNVLGINWQRKIGTVAAVPEPTSLLLLMIAGMVFARRRT